MAPFCPNLSNKKVREKFEELTNIFGEDMAYFLWGKNGGYPLDYAPNGAPSILFKSLMDHYSDRKQALIAKAKVYSSNFKDWFGDWTKKYETGASKVIDFNDAVDFLFEVNPELSKIGTKSEYEQYIKTIFPNLNFNSSLYQYENLYFLKINLENLDNNTKKLIIFQLSEFKNNLHLSEMAFKRFEEFAEIIIKNNAIQVL